MKTTELTDKNFEKEVMKSKRPSVVYFWAPWCPYCPKMTERFESVHEKLSTLAKFFKVNVDDEQELANRNNIKGVPCIILFRDGREAGRILGVEDEEVLVDKLESHLGDID